MNVWITKYCIATDAEDELLWRWDTRHPRDIFRSGFQPRVNLGDVLGGRMTANTAINLRSYVANGRDSIFVSTTRSNWGPRYRASLFRYDIFAPGGIDVNPTLGSHQYENQNEIAFVGGIRGEFIYGALEYDSNRRQLRYHRNLRFSGTQAASRIRRLRCDLPIRDYIVSNINEPLYCSIRQARSKRQTISDLHRQQGETLNPVSECSYWYKLQVKSLAFSQPGEKPYRIEPYGHVNARLGTFETSQVWNQAYTKRSIPSLNQDQAYSTLGKCLVLRTDEETDSISVCFEGSVDEYDPATANDQIASFSSKQCVSTQPNGQSNKSYTKTVNGDDGNLKIVFSISPCTDLCLQDSIPDDSINGSC